MSSNYITIPAYGDAAWRTPVRTASLLPLNINYVGDVRVAEDTNTVYVWTGSAWIAVANPGAAIAIDGITGDVSASGPGVVSATLTATTNGTITTLSGLTSAPVLNHVGTIATGLWNGTASAGQSFLTSGTTYTTPSTVSTNTRFKFTCIGGGGGGSGFSATGASAAGGGGGAGGILYVTGLTPSTSYTVSIGGGGSGGSGAGGAGGNGGSTTITIGATTYTARGGSGVTTTGSTNANGGAGGTASNFTINITGHQGEGADNNNPSTGGAGGDSPWGWGLGGASLGAGGNGNPATGFGGGGGGSHGAGGPTGGAGSAGMILIEWNN